METAARYQGQYHDGKDTAAPARPVEVLVEPNGLRLHFDRHTSVFWPAQEIYPHAYRNGDLTILSFGQGPMQKLEVRSPTFAEDIKNAYPDAVFHRNALPAPKSQKSSLYLLVLLMVGGLLATYFFLLPALSNLVVNQLPPSMEVTVGQKLYEQLVDSTKVDVPKSKAVTDFLHQLQLNSVYPLQVTVVKEPTVNAFALPGGHMVLYTGLLDSLQAPEELAALLGHEFAHAQHRHSLIAMARSISTYALVSFHFNDISGLTAVLVENADKLQSLQYSRSLEKEADTQGFLVLKQNRLNQAGMKELFERLQASAPAENTPALLSTHPLTQDRLEHLQHLIQESPYQPVPNQRLQKAWSQIKSLP